MRSRRHGVHRARTTHPGGHNAGDARKAQFLLCRALRFYTRPVPSCCARCSVRLWPIPEEVPNCGIGHDADSTLASKDSSASVPQGDDPTVGAADRRARRADRHARARCPIDVLPLRSTTPGAPRSLTAAMPAFVHLPGTSSSLLDVRGRRYPRASVVAVARASCWSVCSGPCTRTKGRDHPGSERPRAHRGHAPRRGPDRPGLEDLLAERSARSGQITPGLVHWVRRAC
jgi:hypothetical protein